jgi:hypothetical protein
VGSFVPRKVVRGKEPLSKVPAVTPKLLYTFFYPERRRISELPMMK